MYTHTHTHTRTHTHTHSQPYPPTSRYHLHFIAVWGGRKVGEGRAKAGGVFLTVIGVMMVANFFFNTLWNKERNLAPW